MKAKKGTKKAPKKGKVALKVQTSEHRKATMPTAVE